jgi:RNAse (barnase) inhibitor barstar
MDANRFFHTTAPHLHLLVATPHEACDLAWSLQRTSDRQVVVRTLRGAKARAAGHLFDEIAAALQFPYYFGENWDALDECLADLEWLPGSACILFFTDSQQLLDREPTGQFALLLDVLENAARGWAQPQQRTPVRTPRAFHAVFQCSPENEDAFLARISDFGRSLNRLK